jgi:dTMP kinase
MVQPAPESPGDSVGPASRPDDEDDNLAPVVPMPPLLEGVVGPGERVGLRMRIFGSRGFFRLWIAQVVSSFGDWLGFLAITIFAVEVGGGSGGAAVGLVMSARIIPGFFLAPVAGVLIDRWDRKKVMVTCDLFRAGILGLLPLVHNVFGLVVASFLLEVGTLMWSPAKEASVPNLVPKERLTQANSLSLAAAYGTFPIAAGFFALLAQASKTIGGIDTFDVLRTDQWALAFYLDMITFMTSAFLISRIALPPRRERERTVNGNGAPKRIDWAQTFHEMKEGWSYIFYNPIVRSVNIGLACGLIGAGMVVPLGSIFSTQVLDAGVTGFGVFITALGFGVAAGVILLSVFQSRLPKLRMFQLSLFLAGASLIATAATSTLGLALILLFILGVCAGAVYVLGFTLLQENTTDELRGRIFGALYMLVRLCLLIAFAIGPFISDGLDKVSNRLTDRVIDLPAHHTLFVPGVRLTLWLAGAIILLAGFASLWSLRAAMNRESRRGAGTAIGDGITV